MGLLSLAIWTPIAFGVLLLLIGSDQHAVRTRFLSLFGALAGLAATVPMISRFVSGVGELQLVSVPLGLSASTCSTTWVSMAFPFG